MELKWRFIPYGEDAEPVEVTAANLRRAQKEVNRRLSFVAGILQVWCGTRGDYCYGWHTVARRRVVRSPIDANLKTHKWEKDGAGEILRIVKARMQK